MSSRAVVRRGASQAQPIEWRLGAGAAPAAPAAAPRAGEPAATVVTDAAATNEKLREARQAGYREGESAGRQAAQNELRAVLERLGRSLEDLAALRPRLREQAEKDLVRLAVAIARRVVRRELTIDPDALTGLVKAALEQLASEERIRVRTHPEHEAAVRTCLSHAGRASGAEVVSDPALDRGALIFETERGDLEASAETQLAEIERGLTDRFRRNG